MNLKVTLLFTTSNLCLNITKDLYINQDKIK